MEALFFEYMVSNSLNIVLFLMPVFVSKKIVSAMVVYEVSTCFVRVYEWLQVQLVSILTHIKAYPFFPLPSSPEYVFAIVKFIGIVFNKSHFIVAVFVLLPFYIYRLVAFSDIYFRSPLLIKYNLK